MASHYTFPAWASAQLEREGYRLETVMQSHIARWWGDYDAAGDWYRGTRDEWHSIERHATIYPARMVCDEWAALLFTEKTAIGSDDDALNRWIDERLGDFLGAAASKVGRAFGMGTGAWSADLRDGRARLRWHDAEDVMPLAKDGGECTACAFADTVTAGGRVLLQLQIHEPGEFGYVIKTRFFSPERPDVPVTVGGIDAEYETGSALPTFALVRPALENTYDERSPMGVSVYDEAQDAMHAVDEAFDLFSWGLTANKTRVIADESAVVRDPKTGKVQGQTTVDAKLYRFLDGGAGERVPVTVYNPDLRMTDTVDAINAALSFLSLKVGFGPGYLSFDRHQGLKTATEVSADNSQLMRNVRHHEVSLGRAVRRIVRGAYALELAAEGGAVDDADVPDVLVSWDDSIIEDTATERATMKDDIARGLCPAWLYPMRYYGLSESEARRLTGDGLAPEGIPEEA